jgi:micrococcal nuclease
MLQKLMPQRSTNGTERLFMQVVPLVFLCVFCVQVNGASLFGKVIEVRSGDVITVFNLNRPVRVRLLGVDAPELDQAFGDVARKHLADLVLEKAVVVEYSGIGGDGSLSGRVLFNNADIGAQMIRDGVAWVDPNNQHLLTATDREVYQQSEQAARSERRGLWQEENPTAPWEFVKSLARKQNPKASLERLLFAADTKHAAPRVGLDNLTLMFGNASAADDHAWASAARKNWHVFQPAGENFTVLIPEHGQNTEDSFFVGDNIIQSKGYRVRDGVSFFSVDWLTVPNNGETDRVVVRQFLKAVLKLAIESYESRTGKKVVNCEARTEKNVSTSGYTGMEYDLPDCPVPTRMRIYTKVDGDQRSMYVGSAVFLEEEENVQRFLKSFTFGPPKKDVSRKDAK